MSFWHLRCFSACWNCYVAVPVMWKHTRSRGCIDFCIGHEMGKKLEEPHFWIKGTMCSFLVLNYPNSWYIPFVELYPHRFLLEKICVLWCFRPPKKGIQREDIEYASITGTPLIWWTFFGIPEALGIVPGAPRDDPCVSEHVVPNDPWFYGFTGKNSF